MVRSRRGSGHDVRHDEKDVEEDNASLADLWDVYMSARRTYKTQRGLFTNLLNGSSATRPIMRPASFI